MTTRTSFISDPKAAASTVVYEGQLLDENSVAVPAANLAALTLSLVDTITGAVINSVTQVNILNSGRGTVDSSGNVVITLTPTDTGLQDSTASQESRSMVIDATYSGSKVLRHQIDFLLSALSGA